jgi:rubrerythrin
VKLDEALNLALEFEHKVRDHYANGAKAIRDPQGSKVFATLAREEQGHVDFLKAMLAEWTRTGRVRPTPLKSILPKPKWVKEALDKHRKMATRRVGDKNDIELLKIALQMEKEACSFYTGMVDKVGADERVLFEPFLEIEAGHLTVVQAELDAVQGLGFWFDVQEFALEAG